MPLFTSAARLRESLRQLLLAQPAPQLGQRPHGRLVQHALTRQTGALRLIWHTELAQEPRLAGHTLPAALVALLDGGIPVEHLAGGQLRVPSPYTGQAVACVASLRGRDNTNFLWFVDGPQSFVVLQKTTASDALYLPREDLLLSFDHLGALRLQDVAWLYPLLARHCSALQTLLAGLARGEPGFSLAGVLAAHPRPGHLYNEVMPALLAVRSTPGIPAVHVLRRADFLPPAWMSEWLAPLPLTVCDDAQLNDSLLNQGQWLFQVGRSRYRQPARAIARRAEAEWVQHALDWVARRPAASPHWAEIAPRLETARQALAGCPVRVWIGLDGGQAAWVGQAEALAALVHAVLAQHPGAGVVLDGWTSPCTPFATSVAVLKRDQALLRAVLARCPAGLRYADLVGADSLTKMAMAAEVDFFITNHSSGSLHVSRLLAKPGFTHQPPARTVWNLATEHQTHPHQQVRVLPTQVYQRVPPSPVLMQALGRLLRRLGRRTTWVQDRYRLDLAAIPAWLAPSPLLLQPPRPLFFLEPTASVNPDIRPYLHRASLFHCSWYFPEANAGTETALQALLAQAGTQREHLVLYGRCSVDEARRHLPQARLALWLDEPVAGLQRLVSKRQATMQAAGRSFDLPSFVAHSLELDNPLTRWLSGQACGRGQVSEAMRERASQRLAEAVFIGLVSDLPGAVARLCQTLGWARQAFPDDLSSLDWPPLPPALDAAQLAQLEGLNRHDRLLYQQALAQLYQQTLAQPSPPQPG